MTKLLNLFSQSVFDCRELCVLEICRSDSVFQLVSVSGRILLHLLDLVFQMLVLLSHESALEIKFVSNASVEELSCFTYRSLHEIKEDQLSLWSSRCILKVVMLEASHVVIIVLCETTCEFPILDFPLDKSVGLLEEVTACLVRDPMILFLY